MKTNPAARDLEAAVNAVAVAAAAAERKQKQPSAAKKKVAEEEEDPHLRWAFVRKVHGILSLQFALTAAVVATACFVRPIPRFFVYGPPAAVWPTFIVILVSPLIVMFPMLQYSEKCPRKLVLLALFTLCCSFSIAVPVSAFTTGDKVVLQVTILTSLGLTLFAVWAAKRGYDDEDFFCGTFASLLTALILVLLYIIVEIPFPLKMMGLAICGFLAAMVFTGFVVIILDLKDKDGNDYNGSGSDEEDDN